MNIKLIISNAIVGTFMLAMAGYAQSADSVSLSGTQAQSCPVLSEEVSIVDAQSDQQIAVSVQSTEVVDLTMLCLSEPDGPSGTAGIDSDIDNVGSQTPQAATEFDQLPQDRVALDNLLNQ